MVDTCLLPLPSKTWEYQALQLASSFQTLAEDRLTFREKAAKPVTCFRDAQSLYSALTLFCCMTVCQIVTAWITRHCTEKRRRLWRRWPVLSVGYRVGHSQHPGGYSRQRSWYKMTRLFTNKRTNILVRQTVGRAAVRVHRQVLATARTPNSLISWSTLRISVSVIRVPNPS